MRLLHYLKREGLSSYQFAALSGVPKSRVHAISQGAGASAYTALKILAVAPEVTLADLIGDQRRKALGLD
jgi:hypothetical protein